VTAAVAGWRTALFVGAHPDDLELGSAALIARLSRERRVGVWLLILTDDSNAAIRRQEAVDAAKKLGVASDRVMFAGFADGYLRVDAQSVETVRALLASEGVSPQLVVTHTRADSHNDHRVAADLMLSALRQCVFLHFAVPGSLLESGFRPQVFVNASGYEGLRHSALAAHTSQASRVQGNDPTLLLRKLGEWADLPLAEGYELTVQAGARATDAILQEVDQRGVRRLWREVLQKGPISVIYGSQVLEARAFTPFDGDNERRGTSQLIHALYAAFGGTVVEIEEVSSVDPTAVDRLFSGSVILAGGPVSNRVVRDYYDRFTNIPCQIAYDMPGYVHRRVEFGRSRRRRPLVPEVKPSELRSDVGFVAILPNPCRAESLIIVAAGAYGVGTRHALEILSSPCPSLVQQAVGAIQQQRVFERTFRMSLGDGYADV
jgi:LmbE family N-acetylglucosaminyl deacetylase